MRQENECFAKDWKIIPFNSNIEMLSGFPFDSNHFNDSEGKPLIRIRNIISGETETYYKGDYSNEYLISKGDILVGMDGDFHIKKWQGSEALLNQRILKLYENKESQINLDFFYYLSQPFLLKVHKRTAGTTVKHLSTKDYKNASFKVPEYSEQKKIAEILSTVDDKIEVIDQQIKETEQLKKGMMQRLLTKGIGHTEFKDSKLGEIPKSWEVKNFNEVCENSSNKYNKPTGRCIELEHIEQQTARLKGFGEIADKSSVKNAFSIGDVLFCKLRPYLRKYWKCKFEGGCTSELMVLSPKDNFTTDYLFYVIQQDSFIENSVSKSYGTKMPRTSFKILSEYKLGLPPMEEQIEISLILNTIANKLDVLNDKKIKCQELKKGLMQQLLTGKIRVNLD